MSVYRDDQGSRPIPVGTFAAGRSQFHSTIGIFEHSLPIPSGAYELAAIGTQSWLPNCLASSLYWLKDRRADSWPLVCEDVVKHNAKGKFRHMAYVPSGYAFEVSPGLLVRWLLGVPISDKDIGLSFSEIRERATAIYPAWLAPSEA